MFISIYFQVVLHLSAFKSGIYIVPMLVSGMISANLGGWLVDKFNFKLPLIVGTGALLLAILTAQYAFISPMYIRFIPLLVLSGAGMFMVNGPIRVSMLNQVSKSEYGMVNAMLNGARGIISTIGFAVFSLIIEASQIKYIKDIFKSHGLTLTNIQALRLEKLVLNKQSITHLFPRLQELTNLNVPNIVRMGYQKGFQNMIIFMGLLMAISFALSFAIRMRKES